MKSLQIKESWGCWMVSQLATSHNWAAGEALLVLHDIRKKTRASKSSQANDLESDDASLHSRNPQHNNDNHLCPKAGAV